MSHIIVLHASKLIAIMKINTVLMLIIGDTLFKTLEEQLLTNNSNKK